jgi:CubicO group peptidase (beta-lactamase class C family)
MHLLDRRLCWQLLFLSVATVVVLSATASTSQSPLDIEAIDRFLVRQMSRGRVPGLALAITRGEQVLLTKGYGVAQDGQSVTPHTQFLLASVSKSFTALAVMQLVEAGRLNLDAMVQTYLPEFMLADPRAAARLTIRHLLYQLSGLADAGFAEGWLPQPVTIAGRVASLHAAHPVSTPGTAFHYFNPNYDVLARVVEVVTGQAFSDYVHTHIFAPLQMAHTTSVVTSAEALAKAQDLAQGTWWRSACRCRVGRCLAIWEAAAG